MERKLPGEAVERQAIHGTFPAGCASAATGARARPRARTIPHRRMDSSWRTLTARDASLGGLPPD